MGCLEKLLPISFHLENLRSLRFPVLPKGKGFSGIRVYLMLTSQRVPLPSRTPQCIGTIGTLIFRWIIVSKNFPTYPWNIPQTPNQQFMKEFLSFGGERGSLGYATFGVCWGSLRLPSWVHEGPICKVSPDPLDQLDPLGLAWWFFSVGWYKPYMHGIYLDPPFGCQISAPNGLFLVGFLGPPHFRPDWRIQVYWDLQSTYQPEPWNNLRNEKNTGWLGYIGDYTAKLYRDYNEPL